MPADLMDVLNPTHNPSIRIDLSVSETFAHIVQK